MRRTAYLNLTYDVDGTTIEVSRSGKAYWQDEDGALHKLDVLRTKHAYIVSFNDRELSLIGETLALRDVKTGKEYQHDDFKPGLKVRKEVRPDGTPEDSPEEVVSAADVAKEEAETT